MMKYRGETTLGRGTSSTPRQRFTAVHLAEKKENLSLAVFTSSELRGGGVNERVGFSKV